MSKQITDTFVMVSPDYFGYNPETAKTNIFQHAPDQTDEERIRQKAIKEFYHAVDVLRGEGLRILILKSRDDVVTPDAVFPNNWFSHHEGNTLVLYPMFAPNRRLERQKEALISLLMDAGLKAPKTIDISVQEKRNLFLEATGSMVFDRVHKKAFAIESSRTLRKAFDAWCRSFGYEGILFHAEVKDLPLYHTNIFMTMGEDYAIICLEVISNSAERDVVVKTLKETKKEIISISRKQLMHYCGNSLQVMSHTGERKIVMSERAYKGFDQKSLRRLERHGKIVAIAVPTIEWVGGGSMRCMLAEIFLG